MSKERKLQQSKPYTLSHDVSNADVLEKKRKKKNIQEHKEMGEPKLDARGRIRTERGHVLKKKLTKKQLKRRQNLKERKLKRAKVVL